MRIVKSIPDIQKVLNELLDWKSAIQTKDIDLTGRRIRNANTSIDANDYVTRKELPPSFPDIPNIPDQYYTIEWSNAGVVNTGDLIESQIIGQFRSSTPVECWLNAEVVPVGADLTINLQLYQRKPDDTYDTPFDILDVDLTLPDGSLTTMVSTRTLITPPPKLGQYAKIQPIIVSGGSAACVSIGLVVKRSI